jgi:hypothetical protein
MGLRKKLRVYQRSGCESLKICYLFRESNCFRARFSSKEFLVYDPRDSAALAVAASG